MNHSRITVSPAESFAPMSEDDLADIRSLFKHTPRSFAADKRDLAIVNERKNEAPLTFCLRRVLPGHIS